MPFAICELTRVPRTIRRFKISHYKEECARTRARDIGIDIGVAAKSMSESRRNIQWMETRVRNHALANLHGSTRELAWLGFATCMVQLAQVHGWTFKIAWFNFRRCIDGLKIAQGLSSHGSSYHAIFGTRHTVA